MALNFKRQYQVKEVLRKLNEVLKEANSKFSCKDVREVNRYPHPFIVGSVHIKRYSMDLNAGPCCARIHPDDPTRFSQKRVTKEGITDYCKIPLEEHVCDRLILLNLTDKNKDLSYQERISEMDKLEVLLEDNEKGLLHIVMKECCVVGLHIDDLGVIMHKDENSALLQ